MGLYVRVRIKSVGKKTKTNRDRCYLKLFFFQKKTILINLIWCHTMSLYFWIEKTNFL